jgi:hypothetical protein
VQSRLFLPVLLLGLLLQADAGSAQPTKEAAKPRDPRSPMVFFLAKGEPGACGPGCSEWIAAEGGIDRDAASRFKTLLRRLGHRKLPVFFHSPGGVGDTGLEIGRIMRERRMTAGVGRTIPSSCDAKAERDAACEALKRSGREITGELRTYQAQCNSACGFAILGAVERHISPDTFLGVHQPRFGSIGANGFLASPAAGFRPTPEQQQQVKQRYLNYVIGMGIDRYYLDSTYAVPHEDVLVLERSEIIRYGIDTRKFAETSWFKIDTPTVRLTKTAMQVDGTGAVRISRIDLTCRSTGALTLLVIRDLARPWDKSDAVTIATREASVKMTPLAGYKTPPGSKLSLEPRLGIAPPNFLDLAVRAETIMLKEMPNGSAIERVTTISTAGLAPLRSALQNCLPPETTAPAKSASQ